MNYSLSLITLVNSFWWLWPILIVIFAFKLFNPYIRGMLGEKAVAFFLSRLDSNKYRVINNLLLNLHGRSVQVDHVIVSNFGIFVIETKNYSGWIYGDELGNKWTQVIYKRKEQFYNPVLQNRGHIKALQSLLPECPEYSFISFVVFSSRADLKFKNKPTEVIYSINLLREIKQHTDEFFSDIERDKIYSILQAAHVRDKALIKEHIKKVQSIKSALK